jgi:hypothetical protein
MDIFILVVVSLFAIAIKERLLHVNNLTLITIKYKYQGSNQIAIVHFDLDKNVETSQMLVIVAHL